MRRPDENGIAIIVTMFMVLILSLLGSSLMFVSRTETFSSLNYQTMSQVRYAAESGVHSAANHILWTYVSPGTAADPMANYDTSTTPVRYNNAPVVLSSNPTVASNYPVAAVRDAFSAATQGTLNVNGGRVSYSVVARLISMRQIPDAASGGNLATLQTWELTGTGSVGGAGSASLEVSAILEHNDTPLFTYSTFATDSGCEALNFGGDSHTDSYNSGTYGGSGVPSTDAFAGDVGTNGSLDGFGSTQINGTLSSPRTGVGSCSDGNVTALDGNLSQVTGGLISLAQTVDYPTPPMPSPLPPETSDSFTKAGGCPAGASYCTASVDGATITPPTASTKVILGNVSLGSQTQLHLAAGTYVVNSLNFGAQATVIVDGPGPVIFQVAGQNEDTPIDLGGGALVNASFDANHLQIFYGGTGTVRMVGGPGGAYSVYAPRASVELVGTADFYGAIVGKTVSDLGNAAVHYDRNLLNGGVTVGNPMLQSFNWKNY